MKKVLAGILFVVVALLLAACGATPPQAPSRGDASLNAAGTVEQKNFPERANIIGRYAISDNPNTFQWCTYFSQVGQPIKTVLVHYKTTSSGKRLEPSVSASASYEGSLYNVQIYPSADGKTRYSTEEVEQPDGTFGSSSEYQYGFVAGLGLNGYYQTNLPYFCSITPVVWDTAKLQFTFDESLYAKQQKATEALNNGQCVDTALNVVPCTGRNANPLTDKNVQAQPTPQVVPTAATP